MSVLVKKRNGSTIPGSVEDFFNFDRFFGPSLIDFNEGDFEASLVVPDVNIIEDKQQFKIELAVPGLEKKDFKVEIKEGIMSISAQKEEEKKEVKKNYRRREFSYHSFCRSFTLPENVNQNQIDANYENGVLSVLIHKTEPTVLKPVKHIKVN